METRNHEYLIEVRSDKSRWFELTDVLPEALVEAARLKNRLARDIIVQWLRRTRERKLLFARISDDDEVVFMFTIRQADIQSDANERKTCEA